MEIYVKPALKPIEVELEEAILVRSTAEDIDISKEPVEEFE